MFGVISLVPFKNEKATLIHHGLILSRHHPNLFDVQLCAQQLFGFLIAIMMNKLYCGSLNSVWVGSYTLKVTNVVIYMHVAYTLSVKTLRVEFCP